MNGKMGGWQPNHPIIWCHPNPNHDGIWAPAIRPRAPRVIVCLPMCCHRRITTILRLEWNDYAESTHRTLPESWLHGYTRKPNLYSCALPFALLPHCLLNCCLCVVTMFSLYLPWITLCKSQRVIQKDWGIIHTLLKAHLYFALPLQVQVMAVGYMLLFLLGTCGNVAVLTTIYQMVHTSKFIKIYFTVQKVIGSVKTCNTGQHVDLHDCAELCGFWSVSEWKNYRKICHFSQLLVVAIHGHWSNPWLLDVWLNNVQIACRSVE